jgi:hypothetical protein
MRADRGTASRLGTAFAAEERRGLALAIWMRLWALLAVQLWLPVVLPRQDTNL